MSLILCLETATEICSVALCENGNVIALAEETKANQHASHLTLLTEQVMNESNRKLSDLDAVAVSKGPGSYTGLRVGVSTAKGLCYGLDKPLIAVPTLQSLSAMTLQKRKEPCYLLPMIDARRMEVYTAAYDEKLNELQPANALIIEQNVFERFADKPAYYFGNGAAKCQSIFRQKNLHFLADVVCSASGMAMFAEELFQQKKFEDVAYFEPYYLKDFVGTVPKNKL